MAASASSNGAVAAASPLSYARDLRTTSTLSSGKAQGSMYTHISNLSRMWASSSPSSGSVVAIRSVSQETVPVPRPSSAVPHSTASISAWRTSGRRRLMLSAIRTPPSARSRMDSERLTVPSETAVSMSMSPTSWSMVVPAGISVTRMPGASPETDLAATDLPVPVGPLIRTECRSGDISPNARASAALSPPTIAVTGIRRIGGTPPWRASISRAPRHRAWSPGTGCASCGAGGRASTRGSHRLERPRPFP